MDKVAHHEFTLMQDPFTGQFVQIDKLMVDVINRLWTVGIPTWSCCQGLPNPEEDSPAYVSGPHAFNQDKALAVLRNMGLYITEVDLMNDGWFIAFKPMQGQVL